MFSGEKGSRDSHTPYKGTQVKISSFRLGPSVQPAQTQSHHFFRVTNHISHQENYLLWSILNCERNTNYFYYGVTQFCQVKVSLKLQNTRLCNHSELYAFLEQPRSSGKCLRLNSLPVLIRIIFKKPLPHLI